MAKMAGIAARFAEMLSMPADLLAGVPKVTVTGRRRALVENHRGLLRYEREVIEIKGGRMVLRVRGEGLTLVSMRGSELLIEGDIFSTEFE